MSAATILCADDDRGFCQILSRAFTQAGFRVETAHDGVSAVERMRALKPALVTLDVMLPRLDGFRVLELMRSEKALASIPALFVSGCTFTPDYQERARALAAAAVLKKPVPLDQLIASVRRAVASPPVKGGATLDGSLEHLPFAELLHHLHGMRATGVLDLRHGKKKKQVQLREGVPEAVRSNLMMETLGHLLVASGTISEDVLQACVKRMKTGGGLTGQILLASQMLDDDALARALRRQADEKLFELFSWRAGSYQFHERARLKGANALYLNRSPADLVLHGAIERMPRDVIEARLAARAHFVAVPGGSRFYQFQAASLDAQGKALLAQVDGTRTVAQLGAATERARRVLYALIALELVELAEAPREEQTQRIAKAAPAKPARSSPAKAALREVRRNVQASEDRVATPEHALRAELAALAERLRNENPWRALGVADDASDERIRAVYAEVAKRTHPDRCVGASDATRKLAEELFAGAARAYDAIRDAEARAGWVREQKQKRLDAEAREESERAVYAEREFTRGEGLLRAHKPAEALQAFRAAVEAYPDECDYHVYLGWAHYQVAPDAPGRIEEALKHVMRGRKLAPDRRTPYLFLARLSQAAGQIEHAERMYARTIQIDPDCVEAQRELRLVRMRQDKARGIVGRILRR